MLQKYNVRLWLIFQTYYRGHKSDTKFQQIELTVPTYFLWIFTVGPTETIGRQSRGLRRTNVINISRSDSWGDRAQTSFIWNSSYRHLSSIIYLYRRVRAYAIPSSYPFAVAAAAAAADVVAVATTMRADLRNSRVGGYAPPAAGNFRAAFPVIGKRRAGERTALIMRLESAGSGSRGAARRAHPESDSQSFIIHRNEKRPGAFRGQIFAIRPQCSDPVPWLRQVIACRRDSMV